MQIAGSISWSILKKGATDMADRHMVEQVIKYSDGTETVIKYRGVIKDGVLMADEEKQEVAPEIEATDEEASSK
jgi:hypothetical protein